MTRIRVLLPEYQHRLVFQDIAELLGHGLRALGHEVLGGTEPAPGACNLVLAPHLLRAAMGEDPARAALQRADIVYNFEPPTSTLFAASLPLLHAPGVRVWDYSRAGTELLWSHGCEAKHVPLGYAPAMTRLVRTREQPVDVLFYGSLNHRREVVLRDLRARKLVVKHVFGDYGVGRDRDIAQAKLVLNLHYYEDAPTEDARLFFLASNRVPTVSEGPADDARKLGWALWSDYDKLADECAFLSELSFAARERIGQLAFDAFSKGLQEHDILERALS